MKFTATGTVWVQSNDVEVEVEGNFYKLSKADCLKIVEFRKTQGYSSLKEALHGAEVKVEIQRGSSKASLVSPAPDSEKIKSLTSEQEDELYKWLITDTADENLPDEV